jgi:hypothetical protein
VPAVIQQCLGGRAADARPGAGDDRDPHAALAAPSGPHTLQASPMRRGARSPSRATSGTKQPRARCRAVDGLGRCGRRSSMTGRIACPVSPTCRTESGPLDPVAKRQADSELSYPGERGRPVRWALLFRRWASGPRPRIAVALNAAIGTPCAGFSLRLGWRLSQGRVQ